MILPAVQHVRHRRSRLWRGHVHGADFLSRRLVVGAQHRAARAGRRRAESCLARNHAASSSSAIRQRRDGRCAECSALSARRDSESPPAFRRARSARSLRPCRDRSRDNCPYGGFMIGSPCTLRPGRAATAFARRRGGRSRRRCTWRDGSLAARRGSGAPVVRAPVSALPIT